MKSRNLITALFLVIPVLSMAGIFACVPYQLFYGQHSLGRDVMVDSDPLIGIVLIALDESVVLAAMNARDDIGSHRQECMAWIRFYAKMQRSQLPAHR